jgi:predicted PurR-regulated permease PerM
MLPKPLQRSQLPFTILFTCLCALIFWLVHSYVDIIALALVMVIILKPLYDRIYIRLNRHDGAAVWVTLLIFFLVVIIPTLFVWQVVSAQLATFIASFQQPNAVQQIIDTINMTLDDLLGRDIQVSAALQEQIQQILLSLTSWLASVALGMGTQIADLVSRVIIFVGIVASLLPRYDEVVRRIRQFSPLSDELDTLFLSKIKVTVQAMFLGIFVIAVAQGLVCGIFFWIAGVPYAPLWTLLAVVASLFPLGASLVAVPIGIFQIVIGDYIQGTVVIIGYFLVVSNVDTLLRPRLVPKEAEMNFVLVLLSALGGLELFGFFGVVYGPVLMVVFLTALSVYEAQLVASTPTVPEQEVSDA